MCAMKRPRPVPKEFRLCIREHHSYEVPEILSLPVIGGSGAYLGWLESVLGGCTRDEEVPPKISEEEERLPKTQPPTAEGTGI